MVGHFTYALQTEAETEAAVAADQDWLRSYSKALRNMVEEVILSIKNKRSLNQDEKRQRIYEVSKAILDHFDTFDPTVLKLLNEKSAKKLKDFIETLRHYGNKVSPVAAYSNKQFFTSASSSSANEVVNEQAPIDEGVLLFQ